jgi:hypothetical protein
MHRVAAQNERYFAWKANKADKYRKVTEVAIGVCVVWAATLLGLGALSHPPEAAPAVCLIGSGKVVSGLAFVCVGIKSALALASRHETYTEQHDRYHQAFLVLDSWCRKSSGA